MSQFVRRSVRAIICQNNQLLFVHHVEAGQYILPGGGIETDESEEQALDREMREELGLPVVNCTFLLRAHKLAKQSEDMVYFTTLGPGTIQLNDESLDYIWAPIEDLAQFDIRPRHLGYAYVAIAEMQGGS
jgi:8-oxo-dGTP pyrophosphatase MutT (NUDIX family)